MITKKDIKTMLKSIKHEGKYAIVKRHLGNKTDLWILNFMDKKGYILITMTFGEMVFIKKTRSGVKP